MKVIPLGDTVYVKLDKEIENTKSKGGIILIDSNLDARQKGKETGTVIAISKELINEGKVLYKVGDTVCFTRYSGTMLKAETKDEPPYRLVADADILAILVNDGES